ncbi:MAG: DUF2062 domain-containing protein [Nitrospirae bacterium]|nr:DUF2062 domain-containing protein [Nitrospirota bacterium]MBF0540551.1 DUF2062 domain-containing protein [Nitrospirota bacterium]
MSILNKIKEKLNYIMSIDDTPKRLALSFGIGVFIAVSPLWGLHTVLGIGLAVFFNLNKVVTIAGVYVSNPWTFIPIYTFTTWFGIKIMRKDIPSVSIDWKHITFSNFFDSLSVFLWPFVIGSTIIAIISGIISGFIVYYYFKRKRIKLNEDY